MRPPLPRPPTAAPVPTTGDPWLVLVPPAAVRAATEARSRGLPLDYAARLAGVRPRDLRAFLALGEADMDAGRVTRAAKAVLDLARAHGEHAGAVMDHVTQLSTIRWQAGAWLLERAHEIGVAPCPTPTTRVEVVAGAATPARATDAAIADVLARLGLDGARTLARPTEG